MYKVFAITVTLAVCFANSAQAAIIFSDDFSAVGSGTGFSDNWSAGTISGGEITVGNTTSYRTFTSAIDTTSMDFWLSAKVTVTGSTSGWAGLSFFRGTDEDLFFGSDGGSSNWEFDTDSTSDQTSTVANFTGVETHLVAHVVHNSIDMWIDPVDTSSPTALGASDKSYSADDVTTDDTWTRLRIGTNRTIVVNDMTAATTYAEAVPEPSSFAIGLLGLVSLGLIGRRRKR